MKRINNRDLKLFFIFNKGDSTGPKTSILLSSSKEIENFIKDPTQSITEQNSVINLLAKELNFSKNLKNFFLLLIEKRRIFFVKKILESFQKICLIKRGEVNASLISSKELSKTDLEKISKDLSEAMGSNLI